MCVLNVTWRNWRWQSKQTETILISEKTKNIIMSAAFKLAKKKVSQHDLRRLMQEQKQSKVSADSGPKIDSPFAKYDGESLSCLICKKIIPKSALWKVHVNTKQHKDNVAQAKQLKEKLESRLKTPTIQERVHQLKTLNQEKKLKGILKNSSSSPSTAETPSDNIQVLPATDTESDSTFKKPQIPDDFFDTKPNTQAKEQNVAKSKTAEATSVDEALPEGFFDDPMKDAKARHIEYKDKDEEEWEKFKKEIKEAEVESLTIIHEEQEESTAERQIDEIDAQMKNWSRWDNEMILVFKSIKQFISCRVLELEKKKERIDSTKGTKRKIEVPVAMDDSSSSGEDEEEAPEFLDWRAKKGHK